MLRARRVCKDSKKVCGGKGQGVAERLYKLLHRARSRSNVDRMDELCALEWHYVQESLAQVTIEPLVRGVCVSACARVYRRQKARDINNCS